MYKEAVERAKMFSIPILSEKDAKSMHMNNFETFRDIIPAAISTVSTVAGNFMLKKLSVCWNAQKLFHRFYF